MKKFVQLLLLAGFLATCFSVARGQGGKGEDQLEKELQDDFAAFDDKSSTPSKSQSTDSLDNALDDTTDKSAQSATKQQPPAEEPTGQPDEFNEFAEKKQATEEPPPPDIVEEKKSTPTTMPAPIEQPTDLDAEFDKTDLEKEQTTQATPTTIPEPQLQVEPATTPVAEPSLPPPTSTGFKYAIKNIRYRPNDAGGTIVIEGDGPLSYSLRKNQETAQFIIEIPNAKLPDKLKRPFVTKDIGGPYGAIDAYQSAGSATARVVVQLRKGAKDPILQTEGNSLLVVGGMSIESRAKGPEVAMGEVSPATPEAESKAVETEKPNEGVTSSVTVVAPSGDRKPLDAKSLEEFLSNNKKFYGERQNFETVDMDLREFFYKYMAEWSGLNIYFDENIKQSLTIKLTDVPWDQALVDILRWKKLGYVRVGDNGLRISTQADLAKELDEMARMIDSKRSFAPLITKKYYLSFVAADEEKGRINGYVSKRGIVNANSRVQILVVTETEEAHRSIERQIRHDDVAPRQVLIEGKIVEASEKFTRSFGFNWGLSGSGFKAGKQNGSINLGITPGASSNSSLLSQLNIGTYDVIGSLTATLSLYESEGLAKVISSPRIVTLNQVNATITQDSNLPINSGGSVTVGPGGTTTNNPKQEYVKTSLTLDVTPQISYDGSVLLNVSFARSFAVAATAAGVAPPTESRSAKTQIMVKNGQTAVIGGIYQNDSTDGSTKVPFLADIPIIGWLFKNKNISTAKNELMIFITPKVLGDLGQDEGDKKMDATTGEGL